MSIRIGSSPTSVKIEVMKGDRRVFSLNERYQLTFHQDHFVLTPESHSSFDKGSGSTFSKKPNGMLVLNYCKSVKVVEPWSRAIDLPYFKIDHASRFKCYDKDGVVSIHLPEELKPIRRSMGEKGLDLPAGKVRTELPLPDLSRPALDEEIMITGPMDSAWKEFYGIYTSKLPTPFANLGEVVELKRAFMSGWDACRSNMLQDQAKPPLLSEVIEGIQREDKDPLFNNVRNFGDGIEPQRAPMDRQLRQLLKNQVSSLQVMWRKLERGGNPMARMISKRITETDRLLDD